MKKLHEISDKLMQSYRTKAQAHVKKLEADFKNGDRSMKRATTIRKRDRNIITTGHKLAKRELARNTAAHVKANEGPKKPIERDSGSANDYYKFKKPGQYVGDSVEYPQDIDLTETQKTTMTTIHPNALHVKPVKVNGQTKYQVHAVGKNFASGIKKGEHLSDTELDDFSEMGGKVKHMKEEKSLLSILDEARGRPRKNPVAAPAKKSHDDEEDDYGPDTGPEADQNIHMQLKRAHDAHDLKGGADVKFENGKKHFVKSEHAHKVLTALEKLKPADRATAASHIYKSHENFQAVHSMLK